jgi:DNA-binding beta-propeller fold protein YncE
VCANADVVVVSEGSADRVSVFNRRDGALLGRFGACGTGGGQLINPQGLCFVSGDRHVAVAKHFNHRVSVFSVDGEFVRHIGTGVLRRPSGVACSAFDELVVADSSDRGVVVFSSSGEVLAILGLGAVSGVALHGGCIFAQDFERQCVVLE